MDNDGKIDRTQDSDMDGILNHIDTDDDNDGIYLCHFYNKVYFKILKLRTLLTCCKNLKYEI